MEPNSSFSKNIPTLQIAWDSTSLGLLKTCPRKYYLSMIEQWATKGERLHLDFGIFYHKALEEYDIAKAKGESHEAATLVAVRTALVISKNFVGDNYKNRETLTRAIVWYLEHFKDDPLQTVILANGRPAVELSFRFELPKTNPDGDPYILCGHLDRVVEWQGENWILDRKTTKGALGDYYFKQYSPNNQMSLYSVGGKIALGKEAKGVIIDAVQILVGSCRFMRGFVNRTPNQLEEWMADLQYWIGLAEGFAQTGIWPMNDTACSMYGGCDFVSICSRDSSVRENWLKGDFVKRTWDPLQIRGE